MTPCVRPRMIRFAALIVGMLGGLLAASPTGLADDSLNDGQLPPAATTKIDFAKHIQPIFQTRCYECHGFQNPEGDIRLDLKKSTMEGGDSGPAIEVGNSAESLLIHLVTGLEEDMQMPPEGHGSPLTTDQVALLRAWIDQGAPWPAEADGDPRRVRGQNHWAFQPIVAVAVPEQDDTWVQNPIDAFILDHLESNGVRPSAEAPRRVQIRRLYLDLIGLPPSPDEWNRWMQDKGSDWYERLVDSLLASPHFGERWSRPWLDVARYADSDGFEKDLPRPHAWRWRNWVIDALNRDLPFDQFTVEQLAGDLLPNNTTEQHVATGFHRNTLINREGGVDGEEDRVKRTVDRTNTLGSAWLGMTVECSQCHNHKYDPISQQEYFELYAFFNSLEEPDIPAPYQDEIDAYDTAKAIYDEAHQPFLNAIAAYRSGKLLTAQVEWEKRQAGRQAEWEVLEPQQAIAQSGAEIEPLDDGSMLVSGNLPSRDIYTLQASTGLKRVTAIRLEVLPHASLPKMGPGRGDNGNILLNEFKLYSQPTDGSGEKQPIAISEARADFFQYPYGPAGALVEDRNGWALLPRVGERHVAVFKLKDPLVDLDSLTLTIEMKQQYGGARTIGRFRLSLTDQDRQVEFDAISNRMIKILRTPPTERSEQQLAQLTDYYALFDPGLLELEKKEVAHRDTAPPDPRTSTRAQVVVERGNRRQTQVHIRGDFLRPGEKVETGTPSILPELKTRNSQPDRLDLANWLLDEDHPLTARVAVNRVWQQYFGRGIVATGHDFGTQGDPPSHPELLDYLAHRFRESGWQVKALHRLIVTSATYRQSSHARPDLKEVDPLNTWLARQNRLRVEAEIVRDLALAASGLLDKTIGGRSVRPPQPKGLDKLGYADSVKWVTSEGADRYRRGLYTFFQRTVPYPMLMTFDAPDSNVSCTVRDRSNTPIQALALWNDPVFVECAQALARRTLNQAPIGSERDRVGDRVRHAFQLCLSRDPDREELADFVSLHDTLLKYYDGQAEAAQQAVGAGPQPKAVSPAELAAWVGISRALMNLDEFITKE